MVFDPVGSFARGRAIGTELGFGAAGRQRQQERDLQRRQQEFQLQQQQAAVELQRKFSAAVQSDDPGDLVSLVEANPSLADAAMTSMEFGSDLARNRAIATSRSVDNLLRIGDNEGAKEELNKYVSFANRIGEDASEVERIIPLIDENPEIAGQFNKVFLAGSPEGREYLKQTSSEIAGRDVQKAEYIPGVGFAQQLRTGEVALQQFSKEEQKLIDDAARAEDERQAIRAGGRRRAALEAEEELKGKVEAGVVSAKEAAKASVDAFNRLEKINSGLVNIDEAISLIDQGASTGAIQSKLPSVRAASVKLDNLQGRLGLDVVGNTTFGALSEAELKFALDVALPKKLKGQELKQWLIEKRNAQEKLADYVESAAIFLGTPGNTVPDWIAKQRELRTEQQQDGFFSQTLNRQITEQDIQDTLSANPGLTRESLLQRLGVQ